MVGEIYFGKGVLEWWTQKFIASGQTASLLEVGIAYPSLDVKKKTPDELPLC